MPTEKSFPQQAELPALLTVSQAARALGCSRGHMYQLRARKLIGFSELAGQTKIARSELERLIAEMERQAYAERGAA